MRTVPERSPWAQLVVAVLLLVGGPWGALELAQASAPSSRVVQSLAPLAFPVLGVTAGVVLGVLSAVLTDWTLAPALALWVGSGTMYGSTLWGAAHHGYLPFPEPE
jgi:hypothetical protein